MLARDLRRRALRPGLALLLLAALCTGSWLYFAPTPRSAWNAGPDPGLVAFSPDGNIVVTADSARWYGRPGPLYVWDVDQGSERYSVASWPQVHWVAFSPNGRLLAAMANETRIGFWEVASGTMRDDLDLGTASVPSIGFCFSPDGRYLLFGFRSADGPVDSIRCWDIETKEVRWTLPGDFGSLRYSADGRRFAFGYPNPYGIGVAQVWHIDNETRVPTKESESRISYGEHWYWFPHWA